MNYECSECPGQVFGGHAISKHHAEKHLGKVVAFTEWDVDAAIRKFKETHMARKPKPTRKPKPRPGY